MNILLTNDDGYFAPGIQALYNELKKRNHKVTIVAPSVEQSAKSSSITLFEPLRVEHKDDDVYSVSGTPVDSVIIAMQKIMEEKYDLVISGINGGQNLGQDVLYSGTCGAAFEAMNLGYKALAVSIAAYSNQHFTVAAEYIGKLLETEFVAYMNYGEVININVPNLKSEEIKGSKITKTGFRQYEDFVSEQVDPRGKSMFWIGGETVVWREDEGTDYFAVSNGYVSITPIRPDFTIKSRIKELSMMEDL